MKTELVGYTGFVGSNLASSRAFDGLYNSKNIQEAFGTEPELLIYAGVPAAKFVANANPDADRKICLDAFDNICKISPQRLVFISTVDVYLAPNNQDENSKLSLENLHAYGKNRAELEGLVADKFKNALIIRLPALFGGGLKKNFLYDMLTITPAMLKTDKYDELSAQSPLVKNAYTLAQNGFYQLNLQNDEEKQQLKNWFNENSFNALSFTDSRAQYQFYDLSNLWHDIAVALAANITLLNIATQPISAAEIFEHVTKGGVFENYLQGEPVKYDMRSKYSNLFGGENGYLYLKDDILDSISLFMRNMNI